MNLCPGYVNCEASGLLIKKIFKLKTYPKIKKVNKSAHTKIIKYERNKIFKKVQKDKLGTSPKGAAPGI